MAFPYRTPTSDFSVAGPRPLPVPPVETQSTFNGTSGDDTKHGTSGNDIFNMAQGGHDTVYGGAGNDEIHLGGTFESQDVIRGGADGDTLFLSGGAYASGLTITSSMMQGVELISLTSNNSYKFTFGSGVIGTDVNLSVDGRAVLAGNGVYVDGTVLTKQLHLLGGTGNDTFLGGSGNDILSTVPGFGTAGGTDTINAGPGSDLISVYDDFDSTDRINGGADSDSLSINGDYSTGLTLVAGEIANIERVNFASATNEKLTTVDATVAAGGSITISGENITGGKHLVADASAETDGNVYLVGSAGNDTLTGGALSDIFYLEAGGKDTAYGGDGDDTFSFFAGGFDATDELHGGGGTDSVSLNGVSVNLTLTSAIMKGIERLSLSGAFDYTFTLKDSAVAAGNELSIGGDETFTKLVVDGSAETDGFLTMHGGNGNDVLTGGALDDVLVGDVGADALAGGGGIDTFVYDGVAESTSSQYDTVTGFDAQADSFSLDVAVTGVDHTVSGGALSKASLDANMAAAITAAKLAAHHAVVFKPDSGGLSGHTFLIIDANGVAGYQASADYVVELSSPLHLADLGTFNFV